jgi:hypothetical protein
MGIVYRAFDRKRGTPVALKTVQRVSPGALQRFKQEFRHLMGVTHPNLVHLFELISDGQDWFIAMELIEGVDFLQYVRAGAVPARSIQVSEPSTTHPESEPPPTVFGDDELAPVTRLGAPDREYPTCFPEPDESRPWNHLRDALRQLAEGVAALHAAGKLHRDIKPSNIKVTHAGRVVLLDFGLAIEQDRKERLQSTENQVVGTIPYMAPEQAADLALAPASDWYSVGVVLYEALTGRLPFAGKSLQILMDKQRLEPPPPRSLAPGVPDDLDRLCSGLLHRLPADRPAGSEILRLLGSVDEGRSSHPSSRVGLGTAPRMVGRARHLDALASANAALCQGKTVIQEVFGPSGVGKSTLVSQFLDDLAERDHSVVLSGRCYERESVPYKALDSLIDALSRYLRRLPPLEAQSLLPRDIQALARVFPVLRHLETAAETVRRPAVILDPQELRKRAFSALRELLARLGDRRPLVLAIDDLQWGDLDSAALLSDLLRPPDPPILLLLACYRSEDIATSPFLGAFQKVVGVKNESIECRKLAVEPLDQAEAERLACLLLGSDGEAHAHAAAIAQESAGNPYFVSELVRFAHDDLQGSCSTVSVPDITLDKVLWVRITRLPDEARRVLEVVAVSGRPIRPADVGRCTALADDERATLALLRSVRLIRGLGPADCDAIETYHDRIRETIVAHLAPELLREYHRSLGLALEASGQADPEFLALHFWGGGEGAKASQYYALAASQAADALAFDRAAALYRQALELGRHESNEERRLRTGLAGALANAGRGAEAAREYLGAAAGAPVAEAFDLRRRAAMQFLISGHIDAGLEALRAVLDATGLKLPSTQRGALISLLFHSAKLRLRGLGFQRRDTTEIAESELTCIDVCWSASAGLSVVDTIRGADFQTRGLILALQSGEPSRIARSLAMQAAHTATAGGRARKRVDRLLRTAEDLGREGMPPYTQAMIGMANGVVAYLEGRWRAALEASDCAELIFRERCTGVAWELDTTHAFSLWSLSHLGEWAELARRWPLLLKEARARGDLYAVMNLSTYLMSLVRLAADEPEQARREIDLTMAQWSRQGYHVQHNDALWGLAQVELYRGRGQAAWDLVSRTWPALAGSFLLRVEFIRSSMYYLRARCALAAAVEAVDRRSLIRAAERDAARLEREATPCCRAYTAAIRSGLAMAGGERGQAIRRLTEAAARFDAVGMQLCAAAARHHLGTLEGGEAGESLVAASESWMRAETIRCPARVAAMYLPGFPMTTAASER